MIKLDPTKAYYLGDLSDEQLKEVIHYINNDKYMHTAIIFKSNYVIKEIRRRIDYNYDEVYLSTNRTLNTWGLYSKDYWGRQEINALTLFQDKNKRIADIQVRIQELNNELIELDNEMRELTYGKY